MFRTTSGPVEKALRDSKIAMGSVHEIVLVGGFHTHFLYRQTRVRFFNDKEPNKRINTGETAAYGAAVQE